MKEVACDPRKCEEAHSKIFDEIRRGVRKRFDEIRRDVRRLI